MYKRQVYRCSQTGGAWAALDIFVDREMERPELAFGLSGFQGHVGIVVPKAMSSPRLLKEYGGRGHAVVERWAREQRRQLRRYAELNRYRHQSIRRMLEAIEKVAHEPLLRLKPAGPGPTVPGLRLRRGSGHTIFLRIELWPGAAVGENSQFDVQLRDPSTGRIRGGSTYDVRVVAPG